MTDEISSEADVADPSGQVGADSSAPIGPSPAADSTASFGVASQELEPVADGQDTAPVPEAERGANQPQPPTVPPKPAAWKIAEPEAPWCPPELETELGFEMEYEHAVAASEDIGSDWLLATATRRGRMHAHHGTYREDALHVRLGENFSFFCVCDGAGSSKLSRVGAEYTARHLSRLVGDELLSHEAAIRSCSRESLPINLQNILHHGVAVVAERLVALAAKANLEPKELRCTVLTVLHYQHPTGGLFICGNVGDGFIAVKRKDTSAERVGNSDSGAFSGEVLCFMPDSQVGEFYKTSLEGILPIPEAEVEAVMLCTDGVEDPFFPIHRTVDDVYNQITQGFHLPIKDVTYPEGAEPSSVIRAACPGAELLKWLSFEKRGENDDRAIVFAYRKSLVMLPAIIGADNKSMTGASDVPAMEAKPCALRETTVASDLIDTSKGKP